MFCLCQVLVIAATAILVAARILAIVIVGLVITREVLNKDERRGVEIAGMGRRIYPINT
jgi:hypothetical protein